MRAIEEVKADVQNTSPDGYAWPHEKNFNTGRYNAANWIIARAHEIDASTPEQTDEARDAAYYRWKLERVIPVMQEARDALCALTVAQIKLHNISPTLANRMDYAGEANAETYMAAMSAEGKGCE